MIDQFSIEWSVSSSTDSRWWSIFLQKPLRKFCKKIKFWLLTEENFRWMTINIEICQWIKKKSGHVELVFLSDQLVLLFETNIFISLMNTRSQWSIKSDREKVTNSATHLVCFCFRRWKWSIEENVFSVLLSRSMFFFSRQSFVFVSEEFDSEFFFIFFFWTIVDRCK